MQFPGHSGGHHGSNRGLLSEFNSKSDLVLAQALCKRRHVQVRAGRNHNRIPVSFNIFYRGWEPVLITNKLEEAEYLVCDCGTYCPLHHEFHVLREVSAPDCLDTALRLLPQLHRAVCVPLGKALNLSVF